jgi:hypothetical protein
MITANERSGGGALALISAFVGAAGFAASLTAVYRGMRSVMVDQGGFCASGGPYQINPDQVCATGQIWLLMGGIFAGLVFAGLLVAASAWWGGTSLAGVGLILWAALFGALGWNFIDLGLNPPEQLDGAVGWIVCGVVFWLMALGGLIPGAMALAGYFRNADRPEAERSSVKERLVRANVAFTRSVPGDPAYGSSDPDGAAPAQPDQVSGRSTGTAGEFIDPVTGERHGGSDG